MFGLDDTLKKIQMKYLPQTIWREVDRERARAIIQAIDRQLRNRRLMRSLEKFEQVKVQVKEQVSKIFPRIKKLVNEQLEAKVKTLYKILINAYETDKVILETYGDTVTFKRRRDDEDEDEKPSGGSNWGPRDEDLENNLKEEVYTDKDLEEPTHQEFETGFIEDHNVDEISQHPDWFKKPAKPLTPDHDWNKTLPTIHGPIEP
nr:hypothetical protein [Tanacetum cinerariifolium]